MAEKGLLFGLLFIMVSGWALHRSIGSDTTPHTGTHSSGGSEKKLRTDIAHFAKKHVGTDYKYGGKAPAGFDCSGFTSYVLRHFGIPVSGPSYSQEHFGKKIPKEKARPGDLVFFRKHRGGKVFHVALVYANEGGEIYLIHSTSSRGVVIDQLSRSSYWRSKVMTFRDVIGR